MFHSYSSRYRRRHNRQMMPSRSNISSTHQRTTINLVLSKTYQGFQDGKINKFKSELIIILYLLTMVTSIINNLAITNNIILSNQLSLPKETWICIISGFSLFVGILIIFIGNSLYSSFFQLPWYILSNSCLFIPQWTTLISQQSYNGSFMNIIVIITWTFVAIYSLELVLSLSWYNCKCCRTNCEGCKGSSHSVYFFFLILSCIQSAMTIYLLSRLDILSSIIGIMCQSIIIGVIIGGYFGFYREECKRMRPRIPFNIDDASSLLRTGSSQKSNPLLLRVDTTEMDVDFDEEITTNLENRRTEEFVRGLDANLFNDILDPNSIDGNARGHSNNNNNKRNCGGQRSQCKSQHINHPSSRQRNNRNKNNKNKGRKGNGGDDGDDKHNEKRKHPLSCRKRSNCQECVRKQKLIDQQYTYILQLKQQNAELNKLLNQSNQEILNQCSDFKCNDLSSGIQCFSAPSTPSQKPIKSNDHYHNKKKRKKHTHQQNKALPSYDSSTINKLRKCVRIPRNLTETIIPSTTKESFGNPYKYMLSSIALQYKQFEEENLEIGIFNCDFHEKNTNETLFCVALRCNERGYKCRIQEKLFTKKELEQMYQISNIIFEFLSPSSGHVNNVTPKRINYKFDDFYIELIVLGIADRVYFGNKLIWTSIEPKMYLDEKMILDRKQMIVDSLNDKVIFENIMKSTKWSKIPVFNIKTKNKRITFALTNDEFATYLKYSKPEKDMKPCLIPILMLDDDEYLMVKKIKLSENHGINIAISLKYAQKGQNNIKVTGIHLNKQSILEQHQLLLPQHAIHCDCLDGFVKNNIINDLRIGNLDEDKNKIKDLKNQVNKLKESCTYSKTDNSKQNNPKLHNVMNSPSSMSLPAPITISSCNRPQPQMIISNTPITNNNTPITIITPPTPHIGQSNTPLPNDHNNTSNQLTFSNINQQLR